MTLEELFVNIKYRYDDSGAKKAKSSIASIKDAVDGLGNALDGVSNKLNILTGVAVAGATGGTIAYQRWSRSMVELSGKAGLTIKQFKELTRASGDLARHAGISSSIIRESQQRAFSLGASRRLSENLARNAGILQATGQATATDAVEAAMALQGSGLGTASGNLQMVHAASQEGGGNVPDYFAAAKNLAATAGPAGVGIEDLLAMLTIGSRGGSLSGAAAGIDQFLLAIKREPEKRRGELFRQRTGQDWGQLDTILQTQGMTALIRHIANNFEPGEIFRLFGEKEAIKTVSLLVGAVEQLDENRGVIASAPQRDSIGGFDRDTFDEFSRTVDRFTTAWGQFWRAWGKPFAQVLNPLIQALTWLITSVVRLNEFLGGMLAWLPAIATGLLVFRKFLLSAFLLRLLRGVFSRVGGALGIGGTAGVGGDGDRKQGWFDSKAFGSGAASGGLGAAFAWGGAAFVRFFGAIRSFFGMMFNYIKNFKVLSAIAGVYRPFTAKTGLGAPNSVSNLPKILRWALISTVVASIVKLGKLLLGALIFGMPFALYSKLRQWDRSEEQRRWQAMDAQADYFRAKGLPGGEPAPGRSDIAASRRLQAEAERDLLSAEVDSRLAQIYRQVYAKLQEYLPQEILDIWSGVIGFFGTIFGAVDWFFTAIGNFIRDFFSDPRAALSMLWDNIMRKDADIESWFMRKFLESTGGVPSEADAMAQISGQSTSSTLAQPVIKLTPEQMKMFGIEGGDYSSVLNAPNVDLVHLPTPPANMTPQSVTNEVVINMGGITIQGPHPDDRFDDYKRTQELIREELRNSADYIIQEMDSLSP